MSHKLILASQSTARSNLLTGAGIPFEAISSGVDEAPIKKSFEEQNSTIDETAMALAEAKAAAISKNHPQAHVIGADQILGLNGRGFDKPGNMAEAAARLQAFSGQTHHQHTAVCIYHRGKCVWRTLEKPALTMRSLSEKEIATYLAEAGPPILGTVGAYLLEGEGSRLFEKIEGDYFAILGLPLVPLFAYLRAEELIAY